MSFGYHSLMASLVFLRLAREKASRCLRVVSLDKCGDEPFCDAKPNYSWLLDE